MLIRGMPVRLMWTPRFDKRGDGTRAVVSLGWETKQSHFGILFQHYREGFDFDAHTDGVETNKAISILLHRAQEGGEFYIDGPERVWLGGRIRYFDGGKHSHGVTKITKGSRTVLMLQRGRWRA